MDKDAAIGHIDPQIGDMIRGVFPAPSWIYAADAKKEGAEDSTLIMSEISRKALKLTLKRNSFKVKSSQDPVERTGLMKSLISWSAEN